MSAARLMFERGVGGTSIDEVRSAAAVSGSQISHYFDDKRDLTRNVIGARRIHVREFHTQPLGAGQLRCAGRLGRGHPCRTRPGLPCGWMRIRFARRGIGRGRRRNPRRSRRRLRPVDRVVPERSHRDAPSRRSAARTPIHATSRSSLVAAHQGGALVTFLTDDPEPLRAALTAAVEYVRSFAATPKRRRPGPRKQTG